MNLVSFQRMVGGKLAQTNSHRLCFISKAWFSVNTENPKNTETLKLPHTKLDKSSFSSNAKKSNLKNQSPYPNPIEATIVNFPALPGTKGMSPQFFSNSLKEGDKRERAFFLVKKGRKSKAITSLDQIHRVGSYGHFFNLLNFNGDKTDHNFSICFEGMRVSKTVKAVHLEDGCVYVRDYGDRKISSLPAQDMPRGLRTLFLATLQEALKLKNKKAQLKDDSPRKHHPIAGLLDQNAREPPVTTAEDLRALVGSLFPSKPYEIQRFLEMKSVEELVREMLTFVVREHVDFELEQDLVLQHLNRMRSEQKKYSLESKRRELDKKLGLDSKNDKTMRRIKESFKKKKAVMPKEVREATQAELDRLESMDARNSEFDVIRSYLQVMTQYPWGSTTADTEDLKLSKKILDEDHYGMQKVKKRIIEFVATGILRKNAQKGKILCLVGPPGVGKTSIGRSIARALGKKFVSMSVGGLNDVSEIRGHRRTYVSAFPGKITHFLNKAQTINPVFMIDEVDKIGAYGHRGDVAAALLAVIDPSQNNEFTDEYMSVPQDLSTVLFVCTANTTSTISRPLADRMEFIHLSGYTDSEKLHISRDYLIGKALADSGLKAEQCSLEKGVLEEIIRWYCRETGVRQLEREITKIFQKAAVRVLSGEKTVTVTSANLEDFLGKRKFLSDRLYKEPPVGVSTGLSVNDYYGGSLMYIETEMLGKSLNENDQFKATGSLGKVISESIHIAFAVVNKNLKTFGFGKDEKDTFFSGKKVHIHFPEGSIPKDGPSAGMALVSALFSLASKLQINKDVAMTGEISLSGQLLPIGGLKQKLLAAKSANMEEVIIPTDNASDLKEIDEEIKQGIRIHPVKNVEEGLRIAFRGKL